MQAPHRVDLVGRIVAFFELLQIQLRPVVHRHFLRRAGLVVHRDVLEERHERDMPGAKVSVIIVEEPFDWFSVSETKAQQALGELAKYAEQIKKHAASVLSGVADAAKQAGVSCQTIQVENVQPYKAIIATAADKSCDLIVMASHGRSGLSAVVLGSVTNKVLTHTKTPVLVCH